MRLPAWLRTVGGCLLLGSVAAAAAQRSVTVAGVIETLEPLPEGAPVRVGVHLINPGGVWGREVGGGTPTITEREITFSVNVTGEVAELLPFRSGEVNLPGLQDAYRVVPEDALYARAIVSVYLDHNGNGTFDRGIDTPYGGVAMVTSPTGFFNLLYVDRDVVVAPSEGGELAFQAGWNLFTARFPEDAEPEYAVSAALDDVLLSVAP
jgi:hypothetical protein